MNGSSIILEASGSSAAAEEAAMPSPGNSDALDEMMRHLAQVLGADCVWLSAVVGEGEGDVIAASGPIGAIRRGAGEPVLWRAALSYVRPCYASSLEINWVRGRDAEGAVLKLPVRPRPEETLMVSAYFARIRPDRRLAIEKEAARMAPLLQCSFGLWLAGHSARIRRETLEDLLDRSACAIILLDRHLEIIHANQAADHILSRGEGIRVHERQLIVTDLQKALCLQVALNHVLGQVPPARSVRRTPTPTPMVTIDRARGQSPLLLTILRPRSDGREGDAAALVQIVDPDRDLRQTLRPICEHYELTGVETGLAVLLAGGRTISEAAGDLHIKEQTARTYLKQIFLKTGTHRQADLVRLLLTGTLPLMVGMETAALVH